MHSAPAVTYPVGRCRIQGWLVAGLWGAAAVACALWLQAAGFGWSQGVALLIWLLSGVLAWRSVRQAPQGLLRWDGREWHWQTPDADLVGQLEPQLDFQHGLLLLFRPTAGTGTRAVLWLWPVRSSEPARWQALRRAACARTAPADLPADAGGTA